ncbi:hypothetical protein E2562_032461 [Oryza meyeriana var. granulata]|uniref:Plant heme peroxidase family profile domain-containing protein n=1 Tax=Oryza meyeriana var. granulata TaxID=110450 RepID=A0A6G1F3M2_9ORYZ|nr:hypothetical protein E2562_004597 [Oryza meyeriana var. granulata]KAF0935376.1 hypothetical protein E2562_032461 [Oryza meyeriana var. granulata]
MAELRGAAALVVVLLGLVSSAAAHVHIGAYNTSCPQAEDMVYKEMTNVLANSPDLAGPLLRLFSVDCFTKGPFIPLPTGRRDGNRSVAADVGPNSPPPGATIADLLTLFAKFNLTAKDLVVLSGAHTIGKAHCSAFSTHLYNSSTGSLPLDANYTAALRGQCKPGDLSTLVDLDPATPTTFDTDYYKQVSAQRGLLATDAALLLHDVTKAYVLRQANATSSDEFFADFIVSFVNMSKIGVLTHSNGEIRHRCSAVNPPSPSSSAASVLAGSLLFLLAGPLMVVL